MRLVDLRKERGLSLEQLAVGLGLSPSSRGWLSEIENGKKDASLRLALRIERWSEGKVTAASVCKELAEHDAAPGVDDDNLSRADAAGAENSEANISRTGVTA